MTRVWLRHSPDSYVEVAPELLPTEAAVVGARRFYPGIRYPEIDLVVVQRPGETRREFYMRIGNGRAEVLR
jgi:hypothetical protein